MQANFWRMASIPTSMTLKLCAALPPLGQWLAPPQCKQCPFTSFSNPHGISGSPAWWTVQEPHKRSPCSPDIASVSSFILWSHHWVSCQISYNHIPCAGWVKLPKETANFSWDPPRFFSWSSYWPNSLHSKLFVRDFLKLSYRLQFFWICLQISGLHFF
jgi:hypothetical protein